jgi:hypothetical protein
VTRLRVRYSADGVVIDDTRYLDIDSRWTKYGGVGKRERIFLNRDGKIAVDDVTVLFATRRR